MGLPLSICWKRDSYDAILVKVEWLLKIVYYKLVMTTNDAVDQAEIIINMIARQYGLPESIVSNQDSVFISKFQFLLYYLLGIKQKL